MEQLDDLWGRLHDDVACLGNVHDVQDASVAILVGDDVDDVNLRRGQRLEPGFRSRSGVSPES